MIKKLLKSIKILVMMMPLMLGSFYSLAQKGKAMLKGTIKNEAGAAMPNAQVIIESPISGGVWTIRPNAQGQFQSPPLPLSDPYDITFRASGYVPQELSKYRLSLGHENRIQVVLKKTSSANQPAESISGLVMDDENRTPLPGVTIASSSSNSGDISNRSGKYVIKVNEGDIVHYSCIGYKPQHMIVTAKMLKGGRLPSINMEVSLNQLKEVEVFSNGFQTVSKERSTASVTKVDMKAFHGRSGQPDILARMEGLVPGLSFNKSFQQTANPLMKLGNGDELNPYKNKGIISASDQANIAGDPSYDERLITLRGQTSLQSPTASFPLFVLNNIITDYGYIKKMNPNDIASITVLRDAVANSIYGAQAANGVIIITTKIAKDPGLNISLNMNFSYTGKISTATPGMMTSAQLVAVTDSLYQRNYNGGKGSWDWDGISKTKLYPVEAILYDEYLSTPNLIGHTQTTQQKLNALANFDGRKQMKKYLFPTPITLSTGISLNYGSPKYNMTTSFNYSRSTESPSPNKSETYSLVTNNSFLFSDRINATFSMNLNSSTNAGGFFPEVDLFTLAPYTRLKNEDGSNTLLDDYASDGAARVLQQTGINLNHSTLGDFANKVEQTNTKTLNLGMAGDITVKLIKGLTFNGNYGLSSSSVKATDLQTEDNNTLKDLILTYAVADPDDPSNITYNIPKKGGYYSEANSSAFSWKIRNQLLVNLPLGNGKHFINALLGQEASYSKNSSTSAFTYGYDKQLVSGVPIDYVSLSNDPPSSNIVQQNNLPGTYLPSGNPFAYSEAFTKGYGYYVNGAYSYENKYNFNVSWRTDKSTFFGDDATAQNKPAWSFGLSWNADKEDFMKKVRWVSGLSLRATLGITGNSPAVGNVVSKDLLSQSSSSIFNTVFQNTIDREKNSIVTWEDTKTYNFTLEALLFNKLTLNIQHYRKYTTHLIGGYPTFILAGNGGDKLSGNNGSLQNIGYEISLGGSILHLRSLSWYGSFNISYNQNKITNFTDPSIATDLGQSSGKNALGAGNIFNGYPLATVFAYNYAGLNAKGEPQVRLSNGSLTTDPNAVKSIKDLLYLGTSVAPWTGGFNNTVNFLDFTLSFTFIYNFGNVISMPVSTLTGGRRILGDNYNTLYFDRWQKPGDEKHTIIPKFQDFDQQQTVNINYYTSGKDAYASGSYIKLRDINFGYNIPSSISSKLKLKSLSANFGFSGIGVLIWAKNPKHYDPELVTDAGQRNAPPITYTMGLSVSF